MPNSALYDDGKVCIKNTTGGMARGTFADERFGEEDGGALSAKYKRLGEHKVDELPKKTKATGKAKAKGNAKGKIYATGKAKGNTRRKKTKGNTTQWWSDWSDWKEEKTKKKTRLRKKTQPEKSGDEQALPPKVSAPPAPATAIPLDAPWSKELQQQMLSEVPDDAQLPRALGLNKCYTLKNPGWKSKVQILLTKRTFYVVNTNPTEQMLLSIRRGAHMSHG